MEPQIEGDYCGFLQTKLLTYCRFSLPSLVQVYNFVSVSFDSSLVLAIVEFGV